MKDIDKYLIKGNVDNMVVAEVDENDGDYKVEKTYLLGDNIESVIQLSRIILTYFSGSYALEKGSEERGIVYLNLYNNLNLKEKLTYSQLEEVFEDNIDSLVRADSHSLISIGVMYNNSYYTLEPITEHEVISYIKQTKDKYNIK